jgi:hypothetical protein
MRAFQYISPSKQPFTFHSVFLIVVAYQQSSDGLPMYWIGYVLLSLSLSHGLRIPSTRQRMITISSSTIPLDTSSEVDYIVIGSGIGGLSCAAMLTKYGYSVKVLESHDRPGGVAHTFEEDGFKFDAGPSLWNGMATKPYNPLREVLELVGEGDSVTYANYDGWVMHIPEGSFKFTVGANKFEPIVEQFGGPNALNEWNELLEILKPIQRLCEYLLLLIVFAIYCKDHLCINYSIRDSSTHSTF